MHCVIWTQDSELGFPEACGVPSRQKSFYPQSNSGPGKALVEDDCRTGYSEPEAHTAARAPQLPTFSHCAHKTLAGRSSYLDRVTSGVKDNAQVEAHQRALCPMLTTPTSGQETDLGVATFF